MSNKRLSQTLTAAVALACAGSASAISLTGYSETDPNTVTIRIAGSSAHDKGLQKLLQLKATSGVEICQENSLDVYQAGSSDFIYACTGGANSTVAGKKLVIIKKSSGGSGTGVGTLVKAGTINLDDATSVNSNFLDPTNATVQGLSGTTVTSSNANLSGYVMHGGSAQSNTGLTAASATGADVGISDVEPPVFRRLFNPDLRASELSALTVKGISSVIFGVPVTLNVYQRLQALQFATGNVCNPNNASYGDITSTSSNANSEACMPTLSRQQLQGLYTGLIGDWSMLKSSQQASVDLTTVSVPSGVPALTNTGIFLERRVISSGTQKAFEIFFTGENCLSGTQTFLTKAANVVENSSGGTIPTNLDKLNGDGKGGIGILSTETVPTIATAKWRFIKVDGAAPTVLNVVKGTYHLFFESTLQYRASAVNGLPALGTSKKGVADAITSNLGKPAVVNDLNTAFDQVFGRAGLMGNAVDNFDVAPQAPFTTGSANSGTPTDVYDRPVALSTRGASGTLNACLSPVMVNSTQVSAQ